MQLTWPEIVAALKQAAERHGGRAFIRDDVVALSPEGDGASITVRNLSPHGVLIEAGWSIKIAADAEADPKTATEDDGNGRPYFQRIVEAIMDGTAEEWAIVDPDDGAWIDTRVNIWYPGGRTGANVGDDPESRPRFIRRLIAWNR